MNRKSGPLIEGGSSLRLFRRLSSIREWVCCGEEAERVPCRVEHHADILLWLVVGELGPCGNRPGDSRFEILHANVEMLHDLLLTRHARPDRWEVYPLEFEVQR